MKIANSASHPYGPGSLTEADTRNGLTTLSRTCCPEAHLMHCVHTQWAIRKVIRILKKSTHGLNKAVSTCAPASPENNVASIRPDESHESSSYVHIQKYLHTQNKKATYTRAKPKVLKEMLPQSVSVHILRQLKALHDVYTYIDEFVQLNLSKVLATAAKSYRFVHTSNICCNCCHQNDPSTCKLDDRINKITDEKYIPIW